MGAEGARNQCRRRIFAGEVFHVATGAALVVQSLASSSLLGCEDPVLSRIGGHNQQLPIHPRMFLIDVSVGSWFVELERCLITGGDGAGRPRSILSRNRVALESIVDPGHRCADSDPRAIGFERVFVTVVTSSALPQVL